MSASIRKASPSSLDLPMPRIAPAQVLPPRPADPKSAHANRQDAHAPIVFGFPVVRQYSQALPFRLFAGAMMVQAVMIWRYFPETHGAVPETMERTVESRE